VLSLYAKGVSSHASKVGADGFSMA
jgi:hypothetical protein